MGAGCQVEVEFLTWDLEVWSCFPGGRREGEGSKCTSEPLFRRGHPVRGRGPCVCILTTASSLDVTFYLSSYIYISVI